jgi:two-component system, sensor histidine kinase YesM
LYNLKQDTIMVSLREEIDALQQYLLLQKTRYDFECQIVSKIPEYVFDYQVPRFILQPLVENSIYHGLSDENGRIDITILEQDGLTIIVHDNGKGISQNTMQKLLETQDTDKGNGKMGIGINYVLGILKNLYDSLATITIESEPGVGTTITMHIPVNDNDKITEKGR